MFFDYRLNPLPDYSSIIWPNGCFDETAKESQLVYFLKQIFTDKKICIIGHISQIFDNIQKINDSDVDLVVINSSDHPLKFNDYTVIKKPFVHLDFNFNKTNYHPWHLLWSQWLAQQDKEIDFVNPRQRLISCLHGKTRITRAYNIVQLSNRSYFNQIYTTWLDRFRLVTDPINEDGMTANDIEDVWPKYLELQKQIPIVDIGNEYNTCQELTAGFSDTYLNIVQEARCANFGFLTEKIYKPIRAGQLFLVQASPGSVQYLRSIGFDTFDDFIDHNRYDNELDWKKRTDLMLSVLDDICPNIEQIYQKTIERRQNNRDLLLSRHLTTLVLSNINIQTV